MKIHPFDAPLGAEITGINLTDDLDISTIKALNAAWAEYIVLCIRSQNLTPR